MTQIIKTQPGYRERERKYIPTKKGDLSAILRHVLNAQEEYVTADHPDFIPAGLPKSLRKQALTPREITEMRERIYFLDEHLKAIDAHIEIRQETKRKYPVKQTIKTGASGSKDNHTLDRMEFPARLQHFGVNLEAIDNKTAKSALKSTFKDVAFIPALRMVSQRTRLSYHPEGNKDIEIEMAFDLILWGQTIFGHTWHEPKIEIELVQGAKDDHTAQKILEREERRLLSSFPLTSVYHSNPYPGFASLQKKLSVKNAQKARKKWQSLKNRPFFKTP